MLHAKPSILRLAAFHCQQAAETLLKGLLIAAGRPNVKTHDIKEVANRATPYHPDLANRMANLRNLTLWGFAYRYPLEEESPP